LLKEDGKMKWGVEKWGSISKLAYTDKKIFLIFKENIFVHIGI